MFKKLFILTTLILFLVIGVTNVEAEDTEYNGWETDVYCEPGYHNVRKHWEDNRTSKNAEPGAQNYDWLLEKKMCIKNDISDIFDVDKVIPWGNLEIYFCKKPTRIGIENGNQYTGRAAVPLLFNSKLCCNTEYPYVRKAYDKKSNMACCKTLPLGNMAYGEAFDVGCGKDKDGNTIPNINIEDNAYYNTVNMITGDDFDSSDKTAYYCPPDYCLVKNNDIVLSTTSEARTVTNKAGASCEPLATVGFKWGDFCIEGKLVSKEDYDNCSAVEFSTCKACMVFQELTEKNECFACYKGCPACSYSSAGCIETTQNGIIIRIFQIGLGVVGGLAIIRFIEAALKRQSADPTKIQESWDIISSIIIGMVVLLGSVVILRFISIDVLQLLPFEFLK